MNTFTEENYLKAIYKLSESGPEVINTNSVAGKLNTRAASVTDMLKKLSNKKLIIYKKYKGFSLSKNGEKVALNIIRRHRLWEMFLAETLKFSWDEVHELAEDLEHIPSGKLTDRLDAFLGYPKTDPHGDPIPDSKGKFPKMKSSPLSVCDKKIKLKMTGVVDHSPEFLRHLGKIGMEPGDEIIIHYINEYDRSVQISVNRKKKLFLSELIAKNILVSEKK